MLNSPKEREIKRVSRHRRIRKKVSGTSERPRLCVHRSLNNLYAQIIDDTQRKVLMGISTLNKEVKEKVKYGGNKDAAAILGEILAQQALDKGIKKVCFDTGGYYYHGRVASFAESAKKKGLVF